MTLPPFPQTLDLNITVTEDHYSRGKIESIEEDPIALALKEQKLPDYKLIRDYVSVGITEIFLAYKGFNYIAAIEVDKLHSQPRPYNITLHFTEDFRTKNKFYREPLKD